jgi:hypothetical protein
VAFNVAAEVVVVFVVATIEEAVVVAFAAEVAAFVVEVEVLVAEEAAVDFEVVEVVAIEIIKIEFFSSCLLLAIFCMAIVTVFVFLFVI